MSEWKSKFLPINELPWSDPNWIYSALSHMNLIGVLILSAFLLFAAPMLFIAGRARIAGSLIFFLTLSVAVYLWWQMQKYRSNFEKLEIGATEARVQEIMGTPRRVSDCTTTVYGVSRGKFDPPHVDCQKEFWYYSFYFPEAWQFTFDKNNSLIFSYHWVSP
ncbi:MAG TPA: hypothetical protein VFX02_08765 [Gammaproteobacteria bacterium]|nr:hypothetical protein [Gammaproteobacteria bacterium]